MNLQKLLLICSSIPLLSCVFGSFFLLSSSSDSEKYSETDEKADPAIACNSAAQRHFRQIQHIRGG
ncbi:hypothetical protein NMG60_11007584 [Bertholletia excelsa]